MQGLWKTKVSGYSNKGKRKKTTFKHLLKDKHNFIIKDNPYNKSKIVKAEKLQSITYKGYRWRTDPLPKYSDVYIVSIRIPNKGNSSNTDKMEYREFKAYNKGIYTNQWYSTDTDEIWYKYFNLTISQRIRCSLNPYKKVGKKLIDWSDEIERRNRIVTREFFHSNRKEYVYNKPLSKFDKYKYNFSSARRKFAHKYVTGQTRASIRNWISKRDWDSERKIPWGEKSYAWIID